ncbi:hypothetical protein LCGC14_1854080 [marine sediment metagenome]|uniref:Uncharacterized protein n=1 Tax=marine sediment metagenome TaxID=412755 RepID=A0A0F9G9E2_9ZZZZ
MTETFPYCLKNKDEVRIKIEQALELAKKYKVDIICFPELSFEKEFIKVVEKINLILIFKPETKKESP